MREDPGFRLSFWETIPSEAYPGCAKQGQQEANHSGEQSRLLLPSRAGHERALVALVERLRRDDRAKATPTPGGNGGTRDLNVLGDGLGAATNDMFAQADGRRRAACAVCPR
ncbi:MAG TPA: hypothetical protein VF524_11005 [Polyangia bacterium]